MQNATASEFHRAIAKAGYPQPRRMHTRRTSDYHYSDRGTPVATRTEVLRRGKVVSQMFMVNPAYLTEEG